MLKKPMLLATLMVAGLMAPVIAGEAPGGALMSDLLQGLPERGWPRLPTI